MIVSKQLDIVRSLAGSLKIGNVAPDFLFVIVKRATFSVNLSRVVSCRRPFAQHSFSLFESLNLGPVFLGVSFFLFLSPCHPGVLGGVDSPSAVMSITPLSLLLLSFPSLLVEWSLGGSWISSSVGFLLPFSRSTQVYLHLNDVPVFRVLFIAAMN